MDSEQSAKVKRTRSPGYPAIDLSDAIAKIKVIYDQQRQYRSNRETLARILGYSGLTGTSARVIAALSDYGLLEGYGDSLHVSDIGQDLALHAPGDDEYASALREALSSPSFFKSLEEMYPHGLPSGHLLRAALIKRGFTDKAIDAAVGVYTASKELEHQVPQGRSEISPKPSITDVGGEREALSNSGPARSSTARSVAIPVSVTKWVELHAEFPLSKPEWDQLIAILNVMESSLVRVDFDAPASDQ